MKTKIKFNLDSSEFFLMCAMNGFKGKFEVRKSVTYI